MYTNKLFNTTH